MLLVSSSYLLYWGNRYTNSSYQRNWWAVYFVDPKGDSLDFTIENNSEANNFHYDILDGKDKIAENDIPVGRNEKKELDINSLVSDIKNKKITISVSDGKETKEIYKNF